MRVHILVVFLVIGLARAEAPGPAAPAAAPPAPEKPTAEAEPEQEKVLKAVRLDGEEGARSDGRRKKKKSVRMITSSGEDPEERVVLEQLVAEVRRLKGRAAAMWKEAVKRVMAYLPEEEEEDELGSAIEAYAKACARYAVPPNGAVLAAFRFGSRVIKPRGSVFNDADLLAVVDAVCESTLARGLDLTAVDGTTLYSVGPAAAHCAVNAGRGRGLYYLALADKTPVGAHGAELFADALARSPLRAVKLAGCSLGDRGAEALARAVPRSQLERLDLSSNGIGPRRLARLSTLRTASGDRVVDLRGNARGLELACAATQCVGAFLAPIAGAFLALEARRLELDPTAVASCAVYAVCLALYFATSAALHLAELARADLDLDSLARLATYAAVAAAHAPFVAFVDLGLPPHFATRFFAVAAALAILAACIRPQAHNLDPPATRPASTVDALALAGLGAALLCSRLGPLKIALGPPGTRLLLASALLAVAALLLDLRPSNKPLACLAGLLAAALHYATVLTSLVWHFLPPLDGLHPPGAAGASPNSSHDF